MIEKTSDSTQRILCNACGTATPQTSLSDTELLATAYRSGFVFDPGTSDDHCGPCWRVIARHLVPYR